MVMRLPLLSMVLVMLLLGCGRRPGPPDPIPAESLDTVFAAGEAVYQEFCAICHFAGEGSDLNPPMIGSAMVEAADPAEFVRVILFGQQGPVTVAGRAFDGIVPPMDWLSDDEIAAVATYVRRQFGGPPKEVPVSAVAEIRAAGE